MFWKYNILPSRQFYLPLAVLGIYLVLWLVAPDKTILALKKSSQIFLQILLPLCLVFLLMVGVNLFLNTSEITRYLGQGSGIKRIFLAVIAGIISTGPIYAWYPLLKDLHERGTQSSLLAVFLVNRAIKPFLLPVMISFFGWVYVLYFTLLILFGSFGVGFIMDRLMHEAKNN